MIHVLPGSVSNGMRWSNPLGLIATAIAGTLLSNRYASIDKRIVDGPGTGGRGAVPAVSGFDLDGARLDIPDDLGPGPTVAIVAYQRHHQRDVDTWLPFLTGLEERVPGLRVFEFPTVRPMGVAGQEWLDGVMRAGIPDPAARRRTVTLYVDVAAFNAAIGLPGADRVHVLVLDGDGRVTWRAEGPFDPVAADELEAAVRTLAR